MSADARPALPPQMPHQAFLALRHDLGLTQTEIAAAIERKTLRPCAMRTVQAWEAPPDRSSARPCPAWALQILQSLRDEQRNPRQREIPGHGEGAVHEQPR